MKFKWGWRGGEKDQPKRQKIGSEIGGKQEVVVSWKSFRREKMFLGGESNPLLNAVCRPGKTRLEI